MTSYCVVSERVARCRPYLGTYVRIWAAPQTSADLIDSAFARIGDVDRLMSPKAPGVDIKRILDARAGQEIDLAPSTVEVIRLAQKISTLATGSFDIRRSQPHRPPAAFSWISDSRIRVEAAGLLDLGGIAKGYAVDQALAVLRQGGAEWALVDGGGDAAAFGTPQKFSIRHPMCDGATIGTVEISECALATSSPQFTARGAGEGLKHHLFDARLKCFGPVGRSATVVAPTCAVADALAKVVYFEGNAAHSVLQAFEARGWWWDEATAWHALA